MLSVTAGVVESLHPSATGHARWEAHAQIGLNVTVLFVQGALHICTHMAQYAQHICT